MMVSIQTSSKRARKFRGQHALLGFLFAFGCFSCSDPENGSSNTVPGTDAAGEASADVAADVATDAPPRPNDAPDADSRTVDDAASDRSIDASVDRSSDTMVFDRSIDAADSDGLVDATSPDQSIDGTNADTSDGGSEDAAVGDQFVTPDSDAPPLNATCTVDQPCVNGNCQGSSCDKTWFCFGHFAPHPCPVGDIIPYCGCDGKTYYFPLTCPEVPYEHAGECGDGVNCDPNDVRCAQPAPDCGPGRVAAVVAGCYGPCVPITSCRCAFPFECPNRENYDCNAEQRCAGPPVQ